MTQIELGVYAFAEVLQFAVGPAPHAGVLRSIGLFGTAVLPAIRKELA
jgi:hypothetical protein